MAIIQLISDTHSRPFHIKDEVDFCLHAGDITNYGNINKYDNSIKSFLKSKKPIYWVPGNHDISFNSQTILEGNNINILEKKIEKNGITIAGVSLSGCYNAPNLTEIWDHMTADKKVEEKYYKTYLNEYVDIVVSHSPPSGDIGSEIKHGDLGSQYLLEYIEEYQPKLVICGHVHYPIVREKYIGDTLVMNVAQQTKIINYL